MTGVLYGQNLSREFKSGQHPPIVSTAIIVCDCLTPYTLGDLLRKPVLYHTSKFLKLEDDTQNSRIKTSVFACPDDAAWEEAQDLWRIAQGSAAIFAERLRSLDSYSGNLEKAGGISAAPNPLTALVIAATEPDHPFPPNGIKWPLLRCDLHKCARHTMAMIEVDGFSYSNTGYRLTSQIDHFPILSQVVADEVLELATAAQESQHALRRYLEEQLGTYQAAEEDGRHKGKGKPEPFECPGEPELSLSYEESASEEVLTFDDASIDMEQLPSELEQLPSLGLLDSPHSETSSVLNPREGKETFVRLPPEAGALMQISLKIDELTERPSAIKKPVVLSIASIRLDGGTQQRYCLSPGALDEYAAHLSAGGDLPPIEVLHDGETYWMVDGFHRIEAHVRAGLDAIFAHVETGTQREAILRSVAANQNHGVRRSNLDKRNAALTLLKDEEWAAWSDREIARCAGVSHTYVANLRVELKETQEAEEKRLELIAREEARATETADPLQTVSSVSRHSPPGRGAQEGGLKPGDYVSVFDEEMSGERDGLAQVIATGTQNALIQWPDKTTENIPIEDLTFKGHQHEIPLRDLVNDSEGEAQISIGRLEGGHEEVHEKTRPAERLFAPGDRVRVLPPHVSAGSIGLVAANYPGISDRWIPVMLEGWKGDAPCLFTSELLELVEAGYAKSGNTEDEDEDEEVELSFFDSLKVELSVLQALYDVEQRWRIEAENDLEAALQEISLLSTQVENLKAEACG